MKFIVLLLFSIVLINASSQNILKQKYNQLFPHNKSLQIIRLQTKVDSLQRKTDSLLFAQKESVVTIERLNEENEQLKLDLLKAEKRTLEYNAELLREVEILRDSMNTIVFPHVTCTEESMIKKGFIHPSYKNTCLWRSYHLIELGVPDKKGQYTWTTELSQKIKDSLTTISTHQLFKPEKIAELEKLINDRLEEDFKAMKLSNAACINRRKSYPGYQLKDMRVSINQHSEISFEVLYGLTEACYELNSASTNLNIVDLKEYFVE